MSGTTLYKYTITFRGEEIIESEYDFLDELEAEREAQYVIKEKIEEIEKNYPDYEIDDIDSDNIDINTYDDDFDFEIYGEFFEDRTLEWVGMSERDFF